MTPTLTITGSNTGLNDPHGIARDGTGNLYVANMATSTITVYAPGLSGNVAPIRTIAGNNTGLSAPQGIALDAAGNLYVSNLFGGSLGNILVFAAGASGNVAPKATIAGTSTGLWFPTGIALDAAGRIYVANEDNNSGYTESITVYAPGASGNATPTATIAGNFNAGTSYPQGVALDAAGRLYVAGSGNITVYTADATGAFTATATISGSSTGLSPTGVALDPAGRLYAANGASITVYAPGATGNAAPIIAIAGSNTGLTGATYLTF
ncbi:MAG TPA: NHL repeat-containing protein [Gemmatimonadales bacterium]|nr:NHL repeat-containing protein [Gemmatimonadales bacterium]